MHEAFVCLKSEDALMNLDNMFAAVQTAFNGGNAYENRHKLLERKANGN